MPVTRQQSMFVTVAGAVVFATHAEDANGDFAKHQASIREFLAATDLNGPFRCRFYEGGHPPRAGRSLEGVEGVEWTWMSLN